MDPCQCNDDCPTYFNCCDDYDDLCVPKGSLFRVVIVVTVLVGGVVVVENCTCCYTFLSVA